jgi:tetratricopeptide (TPR) repeat protein
MLAAVLLLLPSCWSEALRLIPETRSPYDTLPDGALQHLAEARGDLASGNPAAACSVLSVLADEFPQNVPVGACRQEAEIALAKVRGETPDLRETYRKRAEEDLSVTNLILAARMEPDPEKAMVLLDRAEKLDPHCAWCSYGKAWLAARSGDWKEVHERVARAKAADPGNMPTRWLETWLLAREGGLAQAITSLTTWADRARDDPRIDPRLVLAADLDRALLAVLDGDPKLARSILADLKDASVDPARRKMIEAGAEQELGDGTAALAAAVDAERLKPDDLLPVVQQALLHEVWLGDSRAAEADWNRALEVSRNDPALSSLLERVRAHVRLERLALDRATASGGAPGPDPGPGARK